MFLKRTSPNNCSPLAGSVKLFGDKIPFNTMVSTTTNEVIVPVLNVKTQEKPRGTCDHNRKQPRFYEPPAHHKKHPEIIQETIKALQNTYKKAKVLAKLFYRKQRVHSQRRQAIILVLQVMVHYMDLETLEIGFFNVTGDFIRLDTSKIAEYANISLTRANRAIHDIHKAGYLKTIRQYKQTDDGRKIGKTAIRILSKSLFMDLKVDHFSLFSAMERKRKRNEKLLAKKAKNKLYALLKSVHGIVDKTTHRAFSPIRKATALLEHVAQEIIPIIGKIERQNE